MQGACAESWRKKPPRENTPKWWTGSEREWKEHRIESDRLGMEGFFAMMDENQSNGGADAITDGIARGMVDKRKFRAHWRYKR